MSRFRNSNSCGGARAVVSLVCVSGFLGLGGSVAAGSAVAAALDKEQATELHRAAHNCDLDRIAPLIGRGAALDARDEDGETPLHRAIRCGDNLPAIMALLDYGADVNAPDEKERTPLHRAVRQRDNLPVVAILLDNGADVDAFDEDETSA